MKLFDCFMYNNEDILLDLRLNILNDFVDKFIIVESYFDHQGNKKKLNFNLENFSNFKDKIKYIKLNNFPKNFSPWQRENYNRNYLINGLNEAEDNDYVMISDLDEIPKIKNLNIFKEKKYTVFNQKMFYYKFNLHNISEPNWIGTRACKKKHLKSPQWIRNKKIKNYSKWRLDKFFELYNWNIIEEGGWHFSYVMSNVMIQQKIKSIAHSEFNKSEFLDINNIDKNIKMEKDLFGRPFKFIKFTEEGKLPDYLIFNKHKYLDLLI